MAKILFPEGFVWGTAMASYQVEGAVAEGGRGETIWDRFCQTPDHVLNGDNGMVTVDHYHRFREDVALMKRLGHKAYRFSICWSRILPAGRGAVNEPGIQFYSDLVDELLAAGIEPFATVYHWDLPQALQDIGGWQNEEVIGYFTAYCQVLFERLGGRVKHWITLNEPFCAAFLGNFTGEHAPGIRDLGTAVRVSYNILRAHGAAMRLFRAMKVPGQIGITLNMTPSFPEDDSPECAAACRNFDGFNNRWFLDPVLKGSFPADMIELLKTLGITLPDFADAASICEPLDFLGINFYFSACIRYNKRAWPLFAEQARTDAPVTDRAWPIDPGALRDILVRIRREYGPQVFYVTENGASYNDVVDLDGEIKDENRIDYLRRHLLALHEAIGQGVDLRGYFLWSLLDNFEWAFGRYSRFGIVHVDFETQVRTPKRSAWWYRDVIAQNGLD